jgi:CheY-like chemotaxis protein
LLVEDNPADVRLVRTALEHHEVECEITVFVDGEKAILFIQAVDAEAIACPDLIIIDLNLPKRPGREVLECIRRSEKCREVPVVVLSSSDAVQDRDEASRLGASLYLKKPSRLEEFLNLGAIFKETLGH